MEYHLQVNVGRSLTPPEGAALRSRQGQGRVSPTAPGAPTPPAWPWTLPGWGCSQAVPGPLSKTAVNSFLTQCQRYQVTNVPCAVFLSPALPGSPPFQHGLGWNRDRGCCSQAQPHQPCNCRNFSSHTRAMFINLCKRLPPHPPDK